MIQKITQQEIAERAVSTMAIRPNDRSSYGAGGMSPAEVRARFDALVLLVIERFNALLDEIGEGGIGSGESDEAIGKLTRDISSGELAGYMQVYDESGALNALQNVLQFLYEGSKGDTGEPGKDGVGIAKIEQTFTATADGGLNEITVTLTNGDAATFTVKNGSRGSTGGIGPAGKDGTDGVGIAKVEQIAVSTADSGTNVYRVTLTNDKYTDFYIKNGSRGSTGPAPVRGTDYWTAADKAEVIAEVLSNFTNAAEVAM